MEKRNNAWDVIRGIACLSVALFHYTTKYNEVYGHTENWLIQFPYGGDLGVCIFFMLTGYFFLPSVRRVTNGGVFYKSSYKTLSSIVGLSANYMHNILLMAR